MEASAVEPPSPSRSTPKEKEGKQGNLLAPRPKCTRATKRLNTLKDQRVRHAAALRCRDISSVQLQESQREQWPVEL